MKNEISSILLKILSFEDNEDDAKENIPVNDEEDDNSCDVHDRMWDRILLLENVVEKQSKRISLLENRFFETERQSSDDMVNKMTPEEKDKLKFILLNLERRKYELPPETVFFGKPRELLKKYVLNDIENAPTNAQKLLSLL